VISELNGWPALPPVNASRASSRLPAHDSGPQWSSFSYHARLFHPLLYAGLSRRFHNAPDFMPIDGLADVGEYTSKKILALIDRPAPI